MTQRKDPVHHDAMVSFVARMLSQNGFEDIRADLDQHEEPVAIEWDHSGVGHLPDVTGLKDGVLHIYEVETSDTIAAPSTESQWELFAAYAAEQGARFTIVIPTGAKDEAMEQLVKLGIKADLWPISVA